MSLILSIIVIVVVILFAFYLIYSQNHQNNKSVVYVNKNNEPADNTVQSQTVKDKQIYDSIIPSQPIIIDTGNDDPYADPIKKLDLHTMYDPLTYPQLRLPREVLEKYHDYYARTGSYPPFGESTRPIFDNPILNGYLVKELDVTDPLSENTPTSVPLFRVKNPKNTNRFHYYIIEQKYTSKIELKIPLDNVKINNIRYNNADSYGLPELYDGDIIENISIYPTTKFKVFLYKSNHYP